MKIKIKGNVIHTGRILKKGAVHEVTDEDGKFLVKAGHAEKASDADPAEPLPAGSKMQPANPTKQKGVKQELMEKSLDELVNIVAELNKERPAEKQIKPSANPTKDELVGRILSATGYKTKAD